MLQVTDTKAFTSPKIISFKEAIEVVAKLKKKKKTVGMCHGGFDLLHPGHVKHFESTKKLCDVLLVSITSDRFVIERKGEGRPILTDTLRAYMAAHIDVVDYVVITDFKKAVPVIEAIQPTYYIKGPDMIGRETPGIIAERAAIASVGGKMKYTTDPKLSTTEIIDYIKTKLKDNTLLIAIDRDGTLIDNGNFFGTKASWKKDMKLVDDVVNFLIFLQTKYKTTKIVVTNQSGVARGHFTLGRLCDINIYLHDVLTKKGLKLDSWQYEPNVDESFAKKHTELALKKEYIKFKTRRKPSVQMVLDALTELKKNLSDFSDILVLGDMEADEGLAKNLKAHFINVKGKKYDELLREFALFHL
jgi:rfaE bifunctional protein nucleotidyltransferase chain/domain